jgi:hypothetical protein
LLEIVVLFCQACEKSVVACQHSQVTQHLSGRKHIAAIVVLKDCPDWQSLITKSSVTSSSVGTSKFASFGTDLCKAFVSADFLHFLK